MRFELPWLLWAAPAFALLVGALAWWARRRRVALAADWSAQVAMLARRRSASSIPLLTLAALAAAIAAAGPRGGRTIQASGGRGLNVLIAVDVSRSMLAEDVAPNRLRRAIREAQRLAQDLPSDRIGVIAFAGQSYVLSPLTLDHSAVNLYLETLDPDLASAGGTNLADVLRQGAQLLDASLEGGDRAMVLFTDGEGHDSLPLAEAAAREVARQGVRLIMVGEGGETPVRIPIRDAAGQLLEYKDDGTGKPVLTLRRDGILQAVAGAGSGVVVPAGLPDQAGAVRAELGALARRPLRERRLSDLAPLAWIGALLGALFLGVHTATRKGAALAGLAMLMFAAPGGAQRVPRGERLMREGRAGEAFQAFRGEASGAGADTAWFNAGTAAMAARFAEARDALEQAARSLDPELRYRAHYNLGVLSMLRSRIDTAGRADWQEEAIRRFKEALLLAPHSRDAKWNLELLLQRQPPAMPRQGQPQPQPEAGRQQEPRPSGGGLSQPEAEAILSSVEQNEASTRAGVVRRQRLRSNTSRKDW